jgi:hypothetical protein
VWPDIGLVVGLVAVVLMIGLEVGLMVELTPAENYKKEQGQRSVGFETTKRMIFQVRVLTTPPSSPFVLTVLTSPFTLLG